MKNRINNDYIYRLCCASVRVEINPFRIRDAMFMRKKSGDNFMLTSYVKLKTNKDTIYQPKIRNGIIAYVIYIFHIHVIIIIIIVIIIVIIIIIIIIIIINIVSISVDLSAC